VIEVRRSSNIKITRKRKRAVQPRHDRFETWFRKLASPVDFGIKTKGPKPHPVHVNKKQTLLDALRSGNWRQVKKITSRFLGDHAMGKITGYYTGNGKRLARESLAKIDIDCHKTGTFEGAVAFVEYLREHHFPDLYWEPSTNGNGVHGYLYIEKYGYRDVLLNDALDRLEVFLESVLASTSFDVEMVEVKGRAMEIGWGEEKGDVRKVSMGGLAKIPRDVCRYDRMKTTTRLHCRDLLTWPERTKPARTAKGKRPPASVSGCFLSEHEVQKADTTYLVLAKLLMENHRMSTSSKCVVEAEDMALFIMFLKFFSENMNQDGSLPFARFERFWNAVHESGDIDRGFQANRFCVMRNYLTSLGLIEWKDATYRVGQVGADGKRRGGKAAKWKASQMLLDLIRMVEQEEKEGIPLAVEGSAGANRKEGERTSFAITNLTLLIQKLTRTPFWQTIRPQQIEDPPPLMLNPDEIMTHLPNIETMWTVAI
jgi:hypothetical protein